MKISSRILISTVVAASALTGVAYAGNDAPQQHIRGVVSAVAGNEITVTTAKGPVVVKIGSKTRFAGVVAGSIADVTAGTFIGTANAPGYGAARALEVVVFPKSLAGTGEGDYPWDLPAGTSKTSTMTNGTIVAPKTSSMTNATVSHVAGGAAKIVTLTYKGGTKTVSISNGVPIVRVVPGSKALLVVGAHVFVVPPASSVPFVVIGENGVVPPM